MANHGLFIMILVFMALFESGHSLDIKTCVDPLGMESGAIPDSSLQASSSYVPNVGPEMARLHKDVGGGAWCPRGLLEKGVHQYLEINLGKVHLITAVATQGREAKNRGVEYVEEYSLEYWRPTLGDWRNYTRWDNKDIFKANQDTKTVITLNLSPPIHAQKIRIVPFSMYSRIVCIRLELYGCVDDSGIISYSVPKPSPGLGDHTDKKYDGFMNKNHLINGLGCLTDGQVGEDFYNLDMGIASGSGWVAWHNTSCENGYLELIFQFDQPRNISQTSIYTNNYFSRNVQVFNAAAIYFSNGGRYYNGDPVYFRVAPDRSQESARNVTIPFNYGRVGKYVKIRLHFSAEWLVLGEVYFTTEKVNINVTDEVKQRVFPDPFPSKGETGEEEEISSESNTELVIGLLTLLIVLLGIIFVIILIVNKRNKNPAQSTSSFLRNTFTMKMNMKDLFINFSLNNVPPSPTEPIQPNCVAGAQVTPVEINAEANIVAHHSGLVHTPARHCKQSFVSTDDLNNKAVVSLAPNSCTYISNIPPNLVANTNDITVDYLNHYNEGLEEFSIYPLNRRESNKSQKLATTANRNPHKYNMKYDEDYSVRTGNMRTRSDSENRRRTMRTNRDERPLAMNDVVRTHKKSFGTSGRNKKTKLIPATVAWNIAPSFSLPFPDNNVELISIPDFCLHLLSNMGSCAAGEVRLYETQNLKATIPSDPKIVLVKSGTLKKGETFMEYLEEVKLLASLNHPSIWKVYGIVTTDMPPLTVYEYSTCGDLYQLLKSTSEISGDPIRFPLLVFISIQVCSAMKYLESLNIIHKDLAARNCLVHPGNRIKVSDVAICLPSYRDHYEVLMGERLAPVRWLSWESILLDRYTCPSSVWSFGVTLWEILNLCKQMPYYHLTFENIIENAEQLFYGSELKEILAKPKICPQNLYRMMTECWNRDESRRPTFEEIYEFLITEYKEYVPMDYPL